MSISVIVLAAGQGTRMKTGLAKVLHVAAGRSLLGWVMASLEGLETAGTVVVVGHQSESVAQECGDDVAVVIQEPQNGTGHAVSVGLSRVDDDVDAVLVVPGDMPLIRSASLVSLIDRHRRTGASATIVSTVLADPTGYGRIIRDGDSVAAIVEERDATDDQRLVGEVNTSVYVFDRHVLASALASLSNDNAQGEYYLTDVIAAFVEAGEGVDALSVSAEEGMGVNTQRELADAARVLRRRINDDLLDNGVWMLDPERVYVDATAVVEPGARLFPETYLAGSTHVAVGAEIGPSTQLTDTSVGQGAHVRHTVAISAVIGDQVSVGPFAYLRPGAVLRRGSKVGTYVEIKASEIGEGSKVPHLSYIGDATVGTGSNIGAGTITVNYDGYEKHRTTVGDNVRIGADTMLVAPLSVGNDAFTGAGSVVTADVPPGALAVERGAQKNVDGYAERRRLRAEGNDD